jgi:hypothetical protein
MRNQVLVPLVNTSPRIGLGTVEMLAAAILLACDPEAATALLLRAAEVE